MRGFFISLLTLGISLTAASVWAAPAKQSLAVTPSVKVKKQIPPVAPPAAPTRVAVLRFKGPLVWHIDADDIWQLKNKRSEPTQGELSKVPDALQKALVQRLIGRLGGLVVPEDELQKFQSTAQLTVNPADQYAQIASKLGVRYCLTGVIEKLSFNGNTVLPDKYDLIVSTRLVETSTGLPAWSSDSQKYHLEVYTDQTGKDVAAVFADKQIPDIAEATASGVAAALGR